MDAQTFCQLLLLEYLNPHIDPITQGTRKYINNIQPEMLLITFDTCICRLSVDLFIYRFQCAENPALNSRTFLLVKNVNCNALLESQN